MFFSKCLVCDGPEKCRCHAVVLLPWVVCLVLVGWLVFYAKRVCCNERVSVFRGAEFEPSIIQLFVEHSSRIATDPPNLSLMFF